MPSLVLDDFLGDIKIELQLSHKENVDVKNAEMVNEVFSKMKSQEKQIKLLKGVNEKHLERINTLEKSRSGIHQNKLLKEIEDLKFKLKRAEDALDEQMEKNEDLQEGKEDPIKDVMNDIINQVEEKEWKRVKSHNQRLIRFHHRDTKKIEKMEKSLTCR
tara:strand:- start:25 stop:504 length:480 start_codon:yes stop_codon:yes gene_type:complete